MFARLISQIVDGRGHRAKNPPRRASRWPVSLDFSTTVANASHPLPLHATKMSQVLLLLGALVATASAQACDYYANNQCIKAEASASTTIPFAPLLPTPPAFVYAIDELDANEIKTQEEKDRFSIPSSATYNGAILKVAWWLQYDNSTLDLAKSQNRQYYAFALETNSTNPVGGGSNGCESLLGSECVRNLRDAVAVRTFGASVVLGGLGQAVSELYDRPLRNLSCPGDIFGVKKPASLTDFQSPLLLPGEFGPVLDFQGRRADSADHAGFDEFAKIVDFGTNRGPLPPGNASSTHSTAQLRYRSMEQQKKQGIVAVTVSWPALESAKRNYSMSDVTVELACLRVDGAGGGGGSAGTGSGGVNGGDDKNMASGSRMSGGVVAVAGGVAIMLNALL